MKHATSDNIALKLQAGAVVAKAAGSDPLFTLTGQAQPLTHACRKDTQHGT